MNKNIIIIFLFLLIIPQVLASPVISSGGTMTAHVGTSTSSTSSSTGGGGSSCISLWDDCVTNKCINNKTIVTCRDLRCGRANTTTIENCTIVNKISLLPPLPPKYRRNVSEQSNIVGNLIVNDSAIQEPIEEPVILEPAVEISNNTNIKNTDDVISTTTNTYLVWWVVLMVLFFILIWLIFRKSKKNDNHIQEEQLRREQYQPNVQPEYLPAYNAVKKYLEKGYSAEQIVDAFKQKGWDDAQLNEVFKELKKNGEYK